MLIAALLVLPVLGIFALVAELRFGVHTQQMVRELEEAGELPVDEVPRRASGRYERAAADAAFPRWAQAVEDAPETYVAKQLRAIVGLEMVVESVEAKAKLSQNRSVEDRAGVVAGLAGTAGEPVAEAMRGL